MFVNFGYNRIETIDEFAISLKEFTKLENLELILKKNLLTKIPAFSINNNSNNMITKMILHIGDNKIEKIEEFALSLKDFTLL